MAHKNEDLTVRLWLAGGLVLGILCALLWKPFAIVSKSYYVDLAGAFWAICFFASFVCFLGAWMLWCDNRRRAWQKLTRTPENILAVLRKEGRLSESGMSFLEFFLVNNKEGLHYKEALWWDEPGVIILPCYPTEVVHFAELVAKEVYGPTGNNGLGLTERVHNLVDDAHPMPFWWMPPKVSKEVETNFGIASG